MSDSTFNADLDALVRGENIASNDELTRFVSDLYGEEQNMTMPDTLKLRIANDLGLPAADVPTPRSAPISRRTARAAEPQRRSSRPWAIAFAIAAAILLALTGVLRWGMPTSNNEPDNRFLFSSPAVPTVSATPDATPGYDADWLLPAAAAECTEDELIDRAEWSQFQSEQAASYDPDEPRVDEPYRPANLDDAEVVVDRQLQSMACINRGDGPEDRASAALPIESPRRAWELQADPETFQAIQVNRLERSKNFSSWVEDDLGLTPADLSYPAENEPGLVWLPSAAIELGDGRIALLPGWLVPEDMTLSSIELHAPVWIEIDGEWMFEEELFFCIGECDEFWSQYDDLISNISTPAASPEATPDAVIDWTLPITAEECVAEADVDLPDASPEAFDALPDREYNVVGPADPTDTTAANDVARQYLACNYPASLLSERFEIEKALAGDEFSPYTVALLDRQLEDGKSLSAQLQELGVTPADTVVLPKSDDTSPGGQFVPSPEMSFVLEDGRIVIMLGLDSSDSGSFLGPTLVLMREDGEWKIDDQIPVCIGECDDSYAMMESRYTDALWLSPISVEECEGNAYLPDDLSDDQAAAIRGRQYRACEVSGEAQQLQGPDFRRTDGEDAKPLSDQIATLHRQNGEVPGSLHRIANQRMMPMDEFPTDPWTVFQPDSVVTLNGGRVAVLQSTAIVPEIISASDRSMPVITTALVWIVDGDTWRLDEEVTVCLGNCDEFWGIAATPEAATPEATEIAVVIPEACANSNEFVADFTSHDRLPIQLRPEPITQAGVYVEVLMPRAPLQYLCESEETSNPAQDRLESGDRWLKVRTEDGTEGWIREIDVRELAP